MSNLKGILEKQKKTQSWVAQQFGISRQAVAMWTANISEPNVENIKKLCKLLKVSANELLGIDSANSEKKDVNQR